MILENAFINYFFFLKLGILLLGLIFSLASFFRKTSDDKFLKLSFWIFVFAIIFLVFRVGFLFWAQYQAWQGTYFLPPYQPLSYFLSYSWLHFAKQPVFDIALGIFFFFLLWLGTKFSQGRFFYDEEKYSGGLAILLNSWPINILVFFATLFCGVLFYFLRLLFFRGQKKEILVNFRYFWLMIALALLIFGNILSEFLGLEILRV